MAKTAINTTERMYQVLVRPLITEKTTSLGEHNVVTFEVASNANKAEIKQAVETLYKVKVDSVNTLNQKGKVKRTRGIVGKRNDVKKAFVKLAEGSSVDVTAGV